MTKSTKSFQQSLAALPSLKSKRTSDEEREFNLTQGLIELSKEVAAVDTMLRNVLNGLASIERDIRRKP